MRVALIVDDDRLHDEHAALGRLAVGLMGEGIEVTRIIPEGDRPQTIEAGERRLALATRLEAPMRVLPWMRRDRAQRLAMAMDRQPPDVLYALGRRGWSLGLDLANELDCPLAVDVCWPSHARAVPTGRRASRVAAYIAPTVPMAEALRRVVDPALVCRVPMGVAVPAMPREVLADEQQIAMAVLGGARDVPAYRALLAAISQIARERRSIRVFLELDGPAEHEIWRDVQRLDLLGVVTALASAPQLRQLLVACDVLVLPERYGELRSIVLEAMAHGLPVITGVDPYLDILVDEQTAFVVARAEPDEWTRAIRRLLSEPQAARAIGLAGRAQIEQAHRSSDQVQRLVQCFHQMVGGGYPFPASDG
jgi:hypothetical protein